MKFFLSSNRLWVLVGCNIALASPLFAQDDVQNEPPPGMQQGGQGGQGQRPPPMGGGGTAISVKEGSVYVISGGQLLKYDQKTLQLQGNVPLMSKQGQRPQSGREGQGQGQSHGGGGQQGGQEEYAPGRSGQQTGQGGAGGPMGGMGGPGGGGVALEVEDGFAYVVSGGKLSKFDARTLDLVSSVDCPKKSPPPPSAKKKGTKNIEE